MELKLLMLFLYIFSSRAINRCQRQQILPLKEVCNLIPFRKYRMSRLFAKEKSARKASPEKAALMEEVENVLLPKLFGHPKFRPGQREIISKILAGNEQTEVLCWSQHTLDCSITFANSGESCLAILPTGAGKSLLYMLPSQVLSCYEILASFIFKFVSFILFHDFNFWFKFIVCFQLLDGITLVVSPLLALMRDQVCRLLFLYKYDRNTHDRLWIVQELSCFTFYRH